MPRNLSLLGSTGSIGTQTLDVCRHLSDEFNVVALAANKNIELLEKQAKEFSPSIIGVYDEERGRKLARRLPHIEVLTGMEGIKAVAAHSDADVVMSAMAGAVGLEPTVEAIRLGKKIAFANKEVLVCGGEYIMNLVRKHGATLIPVDSEHNALFQCVQGSKQEDVRRLILTASGGPFRTWDVGKLATITVDQALAHPTWDMGPKVTIDSSTLMNKGLEVIEARWLFNIPVEKIDVVIHPQSIIHSMIEYTDGSILAELSDHSMKHPIQYALTYPDRKPGMLPPFDFTKHHTLEFFKPDTSAFRCLALAIEALKVGKSMPCFLNAANEILVAQFLKKEIKWCEIAQRLESLMEKYDPIALHSVEDILAVDREAREKALCLS